LKKLPCSMLKLVSLAAVGLAFEENSGWVDFFGWTCRDYTRVPDECSNAKAFSELGEHAEDACFVCNERRRQFVDSGVNDVICANTCVSTHNTCLGRCDACTARCDQDLTMCQTGCQSGVREPTPRPVGPPTRDTGDSFPWWIPVLIGLALLCLLCTACALLYLFCRPQEQQGDCSQAEDVPMMIASPQPCSQPAPMPCDTGCEAGYEDAPCGNGGGGGGGGRYGY